MHANRFSPSVLLLLTLSLPALAEELPNPSGTPGVRMSGPPSEFFNSLDRNHDGYLSSDELPQGSNLEQYLGRYDADKDQKIGPAEFSAFENGTGAINSDADQAPLGRGSDEPKLPESTPDSQGMPPSAPVQTQ